MKSLRFALIWASLAFSTQIHAISLGTVEMESDVSGTKVKLPVALDLTINTIQTGFQLSITSLVDMSDLQNKFDTIVKSFPVPADNCPGYGQHVLPTVESANLSPGGDTAIFDAKVNVVVWDCQQGVPLGGTTVRWETKCVDLGWPLGRVCTDVPVKVEPKPGPDIKNILLKEGLVGKVSLSLATPDGKSIELRPGNATVTPRGDVGKFFDAIAGIFNSNLSSVAQRKIKEIVNEGTLRQTLPKEILAYNPIINAVQFQTSTDGKLLVKVDFQTLITGDQASEWVKKSVGK